MIPLKPITILIGNRLDASIVLKTINILATTPPDLESLAETISVQIPDATSYRRIIGKVLETLPSLIGKRIFEKLSKIGKEPIRVAIRGPSASLEIDARKRRSRWIKLDRTIVNYIYLEEITTESYAVYIGKRPYGLLDPFNMDSIRRSVIGLAGYLISYMLGPYFTSRFATIVVDEEGKAFAGDIPLEKTLGDIGVEAGYDAAEMVLYFAEKARSEGWKTPFLIILNPSHTNKLVGKARALFPPFTYVLAYAGKNVHIDHSIPRSFINIVRP